MERDQAGVSLHPGIHLDAPDEYGERNGHHVALPPVTFDESLSFSRSEFHDFVAAPPNRN
jgi:hypothetical protein